MVKNIFGTDGVRGIANTQISGEFAYRLGSAFAFHLTQIMPHNILKICVGRDTRLSGPMLQSAFVAGVMSMGVNVLDVGVAPTPAISYLTRSLQCSAGAVITASHNLSEYNGIKLMDDRGVKINLDTEFQLSQIMHNITQYLPGNKVGALIVDHDKPMLWAHHIMQCLDCPKLTNLHIAIDCAHGAGYYTVPYVLQSLGADLVCLNCDAHGDLINHNCGSTCLDQLLHAMRSQNFHLGLAFDGDADRLVVVDSQCNVLSGDDILYVLATYLHEIDALPQDTIVTTAVSNHGLDISLQALGINVHRVDVGDKFVLQQLLCSGCSLGGEDSGHIILPKFNYSADALLCAVYLLSVIQSLGVPLHAILSKFQRLPRVTRDVPISARQHALLTNNALQQYVDSFLDTLGESGTILLRPSGTQTLARIIVESTSPHINQNIADQLQSLVLAL